MASVSVTYQCAVCGASSRATVSDLSEPDEVIGARTRRARAQLDEILPERPSLDQRVLEAQASVWLKKATCPRCGAKNPEGVAELAREQRIWPWVGLLLVVGLLAVSWFVPPVALLVPGFGLVQQVAHVILVRRAGGDVQWGQVTLGLVVNGLLVALILREPRAAIALILVMSIVQLIRPRKRDEVEAPWRAAAENIRFEAPADPGARD